MLSISCACLSLSCSRSRCPSHYELLSSLNVNQKSYFEITWRSVMRISGQLTGHCLWVLSEQGGPNCWKKTNMTLFYLVCAKISMHTWQWYVLDKIFKKSCKASVLKWTKSCSLLESIFKCTVASQPCLTSAFCSTFTFFSPLFMISQTVSWTVSSIPARLLHKEPCER